MILTDRPITYLHLACSTKRESDFIVSVLCRGKIDVNALDESRFAALHLAAVFGHATIARILVRYNANVQARCLSNETALHISAAQGYVNVLSLLLKKGAEVHAESDLGRTALHHAFERLSRARLLDIKNFRKKRRSLYSQGRHKFTGLLSENSAFIEESWINAEECKKLQSIPYSLFDLSTFFFIIWFLNSMNLPLDIIFVKISATFFSPVMCFTSQSVFLIVQLFGVS